MKTIQTLLILLLTTCFIKAEGFEKTVKTEVNEVTVFLQGAQVTRKKSIDLSAGETVITFSNLSPYIDAKSIQVKAEGDVMVLAVNHQQNYLEKVDLSDQLKDLEKQLEDLKDKSILKETQLSIVKDELSFLNENRNISGKNEPISLLNLKQTAEYYGIRLNELKTKEIKLSKELGELRTQAGFIEKQIKTLSQKSTNPTGEVLVKVDAKKAGRFPFEISYLVNNASWFPSYDIRANNINAPIQLIYKANVKQNTMIDWKNVRLRFSSANPNVSGTAPELQTYFLNYNTHPPKYNTTNNIISGKVMDTNGESLTGATITVEGTTIATVTDFDGNYSLVVPQGASQITYAFIGFTPQTKTINKGGKMTIFLKEEPMALDEIVMVGKNNASINDALQGRLAGVDASKRKERIRGTSSLPIPTVKREYQTTVDFEIDKPYSVKSENKSSMVDMAIYELPADYQYYCVPKIERDAFLLASIVDWEKYNLMEGEANLFFEDTYVGKTLLDVRFADDTLNISLGRDKQVSVQRNKVKDATNRQFMGTKKETSRVWQTTVKNNKNQPINMVILDQVPVSTNDEIEVTVQDISGAKQNTSNGEIKWTLKLEPGDAKELQLKYSVKYPKNQYLLVE